jgi:hypothetical protein
MTNSSAPIAAAWLAGSAPGRRRAGPSTVESVEPVPGPTVAVADPIDRSAAPGEALR